MSSVFYDEETLNNFEWVSENAFIIVVKQALFFHFPTDV